jgi:hypothetical protein
MQYGDVMKVAKSSYAQLSASAKSALAKKGIDVKQKGGRRKQKGGGEEDMDLDFGNFDFGDMQLDDSPSPNTGGYSMADTGGYADAGGYDDYQAPPTKQKSQRQVARDQRFMTRKMMAQLVKLKKRNDKYQLGYSMDQLKDMAMKGMSI